MSRSSSNEIVQGYIEEVKAYIPSLTQGIESLRKSPNQTAVLEEVHRLAHTIKGASSMVGIYGLSHIAFQMEDALEEIIAGKSIFTEATFRVMSDTISQFQEYCSNLLKDGVKSRDMLRKTVLSFRRIRNLPRDGDQAALQKLLDIVPEHEGGEKDFRSFQNFGSLVGHEPPAIKNHNERLPKFPKLRKSDQESREIRKPESAESRQGKSHKPSAESDNDMLIEFMDADEPVMKQENGKKPRNGKEQGIELDDDALLALLGSEPEVVPETEEIISESDILPHYEAQGSFQNPADLLSETEPHAMRYEAEPRNETKRYSKPDIPDELLKSFYEEAEEHLQDLGRSMNILESQITKPAPISSSHREIIRQIRRSVHTLKGASAIIGLPNIPSYAHSLEDLLDCLFESEKAQLSPEIIGVLSDSAHLLERIVAAPHDPQTSRVQALKDQYKKIIESASPESYTEKENREISVSPHDPQTEDKPHKFDMLQAVTRSEPDESSETEEESAVSLSQLPRTRTLRVGMERVDELVNLVGELIIALSGFDQKMDLFLNTVNELELSRDRLREIAREMEVSYEVKGLEHQKTASKEDKISWISGHQIVSKDKNGESEAKEFEDFDTLELDRYSELNLIIRTLNESVIDVGAINTNLVNLFSEFDGRLTRQRVLLSELQDKMMRVRMTPMQIITNKLRSTVHNVSNKLGKKIRLVIEGEDIELDRVVWEKITDPLMHLLRNAADHGIEHPELRQALGKTPVGTIRLSASREGNQVVIRITDDGAGLNYPAIRETAKKLRLTDKADEMSEEELAMFIFYPGFSTRGKISEVSGRGVGMDVVKQNIQDLKGTIRIASWKDKGSRFTIRIPLTLAVIRALLFTVRGQVFALALNEIKEIVRVDPGHITGRIEQVVRLGDEVLPLYYLGKILNSGKRDVDGEISSSGEQRPVVLVVETGEKRVALVIDNLVGQREIVIKSTGSHLRYVKGISGVTIMGDGSVVPILNLDELLRIKTVVSEDFRSFQNFGSLDQMPVSEKPLQIMVVDDSVSIRQVVSRLMEEQGWRVQTAKDGIDALEKLRDFRPDLIVLDIEMPRMNGYEFLSAIRVQPVFQGIPVVMLTSRTTSKHRDKAVALGAKGFIAKPYNDDDFVNLILRLTERK